MPAENDGSKRHEGLTGPKHDFHEARFRNMMRVWAGTKEDGPASTPEETSSQNKEDKSPVFSSVIENTTVTPVQGFNDGGKYRPPSNGNGGMYWFGSSKHNRVLFLLLGVIVILLLLLFGGSGVSNETKKEIYVEKKKTMQPETQVVREAPVRRFESAPPVSSITESPQPPTKILNTFTCGEGQAEESSRGFAAMDIQNMDRNGVSYQIPVGCAWIKVSTQVQNLTGSDFLFAVKDSSSPTGKMGCGTYGVVDGSYSVKECMRFLNDRKGQMIEVYVKGVVFIN